MNEMIILTLLAGSLLLNLITMILVIVLLKKNNNHAVQDVGNAVAQLSSSKTNDTSLGVVFCRDCGHQYDSLLAACPNCQRPR